MDKFFLLPLSSLGCRENREGSEVETKERRLEAVGMDEKENKGRETDGFWKGVLAERESEK